MCKVPRVLFGVVPKLLSRMPLERFLLISVELSKLVKSELRNNVSSSVDTNVMFTVLFSEWNRPAASAVILTLCRLIEPRALISEAGNRTLFVTLSSSTNMSSTINVRGGSNVTFRTETGTSSVLAKTTGPQCLAIEAWCLVKQVLTGNFTVSGSRRSVVSLVLVLAMSRKCSGTNMTSETVRKSAKKTAY